MQGLKQKIIVVSPFQESSLPQRMFLILLQKGMFWAILMESFNLKTHQLFTLFFSFAKVEFNFIFDEHNILLCVKNWDKK